MNRNPVARVVAVVLLGMIFASYIDHDQKKWRQLGRGAFLAHEAERFDMYMMRPQHFGLTAFGALFVAGRLFGFYELIVLALSAVLRTSAAAQERRPGGTNLPFF